MNNEHRGKTRTRAAGRADERAEGRADERAEGRAASRYAIIAAASPDGITKERADENGAYPRPTQMNAEQRTSVSE